MLYKSIEKITNSCILDSKTLLQFKILNVIINSYFCGMSLKYSKELVYNWAWN